MGADGWHGTQWQIQYIYPMYGNTDSICRMKEKKMSEFLPEATPFAAVVVLCTSPCTSGWVVGQI